MSKNNAKNRGFSLMEVLVVIAVMGMLFSLSIPNFRSYRNHVAVRTTAKKMQSMLWEAQALSLSPRSSQTASYKVNVQTCVIPNCTPSTIVSDPPEGTEGYAVLGTFAPEDRIYISDIQFYKGSATASVDSVGLSFAVGNKTGGTISISDADGNIGEKAEIFFSSLDTQVRYKVTASSGTNIIGMDLISPAT